MLLKVHSEAVLCMKRPQGLWSIGEMVYIDPSSARESWREHDSRGRGPRGNESKGVTMMCLAHRCTWHFGPIPYAHGRLCCPASRHALVLQILC